MKIEKTICKRKRFDIIIDLVGEMSRCYPMKFSIEFVDLIDEMQRESKNDCDLIIIYRIVEIVIDENQ